MKVYKLSIQICCLALFLFLLACSRPASQLQPVAVKGILDLSQWDFEKNGDLTLEGEWDFIWNQFLSYEQILNMKAKITSYMNVPGHWRGLKAGDSVLPGDGYCTVHLLVKLPAISKDLAIKIPDIGTAHRIWINDNLIYEAGRIGKTEKEMIPYLMPEIRLLNFQNEKEFHITLQMSNFMDRTGGVWGHFTLGKSKDLDRRKSIVLSLEMMVFGGLFIMSIYHFGLFTIRRQDRSTLFFGLFCLDYAIRTLLVEHRILMRIFPSLPFDLTFRLEYLTAYLVFPFFVSFFSHLFSKEFNLYYIRAVWIFILVLCTTVILFPHYIYTQFLIPFEAAVFCSIPYLLYANLSAIRNRRVGSVTSFAGVVILGIGAVTDILHNEHIIFLHYTFPFCLFGFLFFQSFSLSTKFSKAFSISEKQALELSEKTVSLTNTNEELNELKTELEKKVEERSRTLELVYRESVIEMQKVSSLEKELAVQKERQKIFVDIHDHMGSNILDLKNFIEDIASDEKNDDIIIKKAKFTINKLEDNLRMKLYAIEDLEILRKDPLNGIRLLILRRYSIPNREINFFCEEDLYEIPRSSFSEKLVEVLFSVSQENATNDLRYGSGLSEWRFFLRKQNLCLEMISSTNYTIDHKGSGNGRKNIENRLHEIGGYSMYCDDMKIFHTRFYFPLSR